MNWPLNCGDNIMDRAVEFKLKAIKQKFSTRKITCVEDVVSIARRFYGDDIMIYESAFIILLNPVGSAIGYAKISQGGLQSTSVDVRIIAKYAIESLATSVILVHNHPSSECRPTGVDIKLAAALKKGLSLLHIQLYDSVIITENGHFSMREEGLIG
uniref:JAB domain-containing protein n=1 Tax=Barnesiella intestinihominis TaxID=487174 RepID=UPI0040387711